MVFATACAVWLPVVEGVAPATRIRIHWQHA